MKRLSPIERMIDMACGAPSDPPVTDAFNGVTVDPVRLVCTLCQASIVVEREPDFYDFVEIETTCPRCVRD